MPSRLEACSSALRGRRYLDAIGAEIESAVANQQALALDAPLPVRANSESSWPPRPETFSAWLRNRRRQSSQGGWAAIAVRTVRDRTGAGRT